MEDLPQIASEIARQLARLSRWLAHTEGSYQPSTQGALQPPFGNLEMSDWVRAMHLWREHGVALIRDQPARACPACGQSEHRFLFYSFDSYPYVDCLRCGTWYVPLVVDDRLFERYCAVCPEAGQIIEKLAAQRLDEPRADVDRARFSTYFSELEPLVPAVRRDLLDVGCGVGHSLEVAAARGWRGCGMESSPSLIQAARNRGLKVLHPDDHIGRRDFGVISLWETLEHINDPFTLLAGVVPLLHDDGLVAITVPNMLAIEARIMRQDLAWINGGGIGTVHINLFQKSSLEHLLSRVGLNIVGVDGEYGFNARELASYFLGDHRGAWDYARGVRVEPKLSEETIGFLNWVGPAWSVLARQLQLTPIIKIIATKSGDADAVARMRSGYARARRDEMIAELDRVYPER